MIMRVAIALFVAFCGGLALLLTKRGWYVFELGHVSESGLDSSAALQREPSAEELADEAREDARIEEAENKAGKECKSMRSRHPGMYNSMPMQFIHLPKTGGSSIQLALHDWSAANPRVRLLMWNDPAVHDDSTACPFRSSESTLFIGHRGWGFCKHVEHHPKGLFTVTAVREAVSRMVSLYDYNIRTRQTERSQKVFTATSQMTKYTLRDLIKRYNATKDIVEPGELILRFSGSQQTRYMCGYECLGPNALHNDTITEEFMLKRALYNLRRTDCVGVTDRLSDLIIQLKYNVPWIPSRAQTFPRQNKLQAEFKSVLDEESETIMRAWAWTDTKLYQEALIIAARKTATAKKCYAKVHG